LPQDSVYGLEHSDEERERRVTGSRFFGDLREAAINGYLLLSVVLLSVSAAQATPQVKVMSRNLYLGADLTPTIQATNGHRMRQPVPIRNAPYRARVPVVVHSIGVPPAKIVRAGCRGRGGYMNGTGNVPVCVDASTALRSF
jgi:hypothetical protein